MSPGWLKKGITATNNNNKNNSNNNHQWHLVFAAVDAAAVDAAC
jgi:hypothetical protein